MQRYLVTYVGMRFVRVTLRLSLHHPFPRLCVTRLATAAVVSDRKREMGGGCNVPDLETVSSLFPSIVCPRVWYKVHYHGVYLAFYDHAYLCMDVHGSCAGCRGVERDGVR